MAQDTKFTLSTSDLQTLADTDFFIRKREITDKIALGMGHINARLRAILTQRQKELPQVWQHPGAGKISRGEQLEMLPYMVLDQPAWFAPSGVLSFRILAWWGNGFAVQLIVSGDQLELIRHTDWEDLPEQGEYLVHEDMWVNNRTSFKSRDEITALAGSPYQYAQSQNYFKMSYGLPFEKSGELPDIAASLLHKIIDVLNFRNQ